MDARASDRKDISSVVSNSAGDFILGGNADNTTTDGFVITGASNVSRTGVQAFQAPSGLTLLDDVISFNGNGVDIQNPDGSMPP